MPAVSRWALFKMWASPSVEAVRRISTWNESEVRVNTPVTLGDTDVPKFTWLHLTDLHVGMSLGKAEWPGAEYQVLQDLTRSVSLAKSPVDIIIFTGDLTQQANATEYAELDRTLAIIRKTVVDAGGGDPIFLAVPGNHDLERDKANEGAAECLRDLERTGLRAKFWKGPDNDYRRSVGSAFKRWTDWSSKAIQWDRLHDVRRNGVLPGEFAVTYARPEHGLRIGLLGLNTAATQLAEGDYLKKLSMNGLQATTLLVKPHEWSAGHDACLFLSHHPPDWLDAEGLDAYRNQVAHPDWFDVHLCGHQHSQERLQIVRGGASTLPLVVGRSLFGLEEFGEPGQKKQRLFGYSLGQIRFGPIRSMRFWPRANQDKQGGSWRIEQDHTETGLDPNDQGSLPVELAVRPRQSQFVEGSVPTSAIHPEGWDLIDVGFLRRAVDALRPKDLSEYFDGDDPQWSTMASGRISQRKIVDDVVAKLEESRKNFLSVHLIIGPGGEGKTTVLMQAAAALARKDHWRVLWRSQTEDGAGGVLDRQRLSPCIANDTALCIVVDDAHEIRQDLTRFTDRDKIDGLLRQHPGASIHLLLCAHKDDWAISRRPRERFKVIEIPIPQLDLVDALAITRSYRTEGALGQLDARAGIEQNAELLVSIAKASASSSEAALLGALISARTGDSLDVHVRRILERVAASSSASGLPVASTFVTVAVANLGGLHRLRTDVLCEALQESETRVEDAIGTAASEMRMEGVGLGRSIRVRHGAIARRAARIAFGAAPSDPFYFSKKRMYASLAKALVKTIPQFWISPLAAPFLEHSSKSLHNDPIMAVAIAEGAVEGAPGNSHLRTKLSQCYREVMDGDPSEAFATCRSYFVDGGALDRTFAREWAVAAGADTDISTHAARNIWLALLAASDQIPGAAIDEADLRHLPTITKGLSLMRSDLPRQLSAKAAAKVLAIGRLVSGTPHLRTAAALSGKNPAATLQHLAATFHALARSAWAKCDDEFKEMMVTRVEALAFTHKSDAWRSTK